jgi:hypothetical protein
VIDMTKGLVSGLSLLRAVLMGTAALALAGPAAAQSKVGVTSATDGDPLGKPPIDNERILRIGIDVQANEVVTTHSNDRAHLVFLDGTSLTVGPNARLTIDRFVYDPNTKQGDLAITTTQGVFRLVGGKISKTNTITITTPSSTIGIRGGITIFNVGSGRTIANFIFGNSMTVNGQGQIQNVTRPGSQVIVNNGAPPSLPTLLPPGGLNSLISQLETGGNSGTSGTGGNADQKSQSSGYSAGNSGQPQNPPGTPPGTNPGNPPNTNNNNVTQAVSNSGGGSNPQTNTTTTTTTTTTTMVPKTTQTLNGYVGGLVVLSNSGEDRQSITAALSTAHSKPTDLTIKTDATANTVKSTIIIRGLDGDVTSPTATLHLGTGHRGTSFFQDDLHFVTGTTNGHGTLRFGETTVRVRDTSVLLTAAQLPSTVTPYVGTGCTCDFLTFGEWETTVTPGRHHGHDGLHLGDGTAVVTQAPWVAGTLATQLPNTQSASFSGGMWGQAQNGNGPIRNVTGTFGINNYSWSQGSGGWTANFDNRTYNGQVSSTGGVSFGNNSIPATVGNRAMSVAGSFYTGPGAGGSVMGVAGQFGVNGPQHYLASGVFGGSKQ